MADIVNCSFFDASAEGDKLTRADVTVATGLAPRQTRLRRACRYAAITWQQDAWAMPVNDQWEVYRRLGVIRGIDVERDRVLPTREAAEMWMLHRGS